MMPARLTRVRYEAHRAGAVGVASVKRPVSAGQTRWDWMALRLGWSGDWRRWSSWRSSLGSRLSFVAGRRDCARCRRALICRGWWVGNDDHFTQSGFRRGGGGHFA